jgi:hypothetical protein
VKLKTQRLLLNLTTSGLLMAGCGGLAALVMVPIDEDQADGLSANSVLPSQRPTTSDNPLATIDTNHPVWNREWRRPLYDPPPPTVVAAPPRPITVKLMGTIIEPDNSQAFVETTSGTVELKRIGDSLTSDPADGTIAEIAATQITIKRADGEHQLKVSE